MLIFLKTCVLFVGELFKTNNDFMLKINNWSEIQKPKAVPENMHKIGLPVISFQTTAHIVYVLFLFQITLWYAILLYRM